MENFCEGFLFLFFELEWKDMLSYVIYLIDDIFEEFVKIYYLVFVMFYVLCKFVCVLFDFLDMKIM